MEEHAKRRYHTSFIFKILQSFIGFAIFLLLGLFIFSLIELISFTFSQELPDSFFNLMLKSMILDVLFWIKFIFPLGALYMLVALFSSKLANFLTSILILLFFIIHLMLLSYYHTSLVLLGSDLFGYSLNDISQTVGAAGVLSLSSVLLFILTFMVLILGIIFLRPKLMVNKYLAAGIFSVSLIAFFAGDLNTLKPKYTDDFSNNLIVNKSGHFYEAAYNYYTQSGYSIDIYAANYLDLVDKRLSQEGTFDYLDPQFPFLHKADTTDVLSSFFKQKNKPPNIVILVVEGLGRAFTNKDANLGNFTPYLDSLSQESIYFKNFLSNGGRTFAVLPSLLGSAPFAQNGFLALENKMPSQLSLINILEKNGYATSFFYAGNASFDNMNGYLNLNKTNRIFDEKTFTSSYSKLPEKGGFTWGYGDQELYDYYLSKTSTDTTQKPRLDILLTVTTHSPFILSEQKKYLQKFEDRLDLLDFDAAVKKQRQSFAEEFATVMYADDALKTLLDRYKKRPDYENTIFVITGDHRIPEIPLETKIDRYHVPLIIYSPMLKKTKEISSISSHFDVTPSLLKYLHKSYSITIPTENSFLSKGLDTTATFRNIHQIPLMQTKTDLVDFVSGTYHLNGNQLFQIFENMYEEEIFDQAKKEELQAAFADFKNRNQKIAQGSKLVPDSLIVKYTN